MDAADAAVTVAGWTVVAAALGRRRAPLAQAAGRRLVLTGLALALGATLLVTALLLAARLARAEAARASPPPASSTNGQA